MAIRSGRNEETAQGRLHTRGKAVVEIHCRGLASDGFAISCSVGPYTRSVSPTPTFLQVGGVTLQIVRDWVRKFNASGPEGLVDHWAAGPSPKLTDAHRQSLTSVIEAGPAPAIHGVVRWRLVDLCQWLWDKFRINLSKSSMSRKVRAMGYRKLSAHPRHQAQAEGAIEAFKKISPPAWRKSPRQRTSHVPI